MFLKAPELSPGPRPPRCSSPWSSWGPGTKFAPLGGEWTYCAAAAAFLLRAFSPCPCLSRPSTQDTGTKHWGPSETGGTWSLCTADSGGSSVLSRELSFRNPGDRPGQHVSISEAPAGNREAWLSSLQSPGKSLQTPGVGGRGSLELSRAHSLVLMFPGTLGLGGITQPAGHVISR